MLGDYDPRQGTIYQVLNEQGMVIDAKAPLPSDDLLKTFYCDMVRLREVDEKAFKLQRQGRMNTYPQMRGHEAIQVGSAYALQKHDWIAPSYREGGLMHLRGVPFSNILAFWLGHEKGSHFPKGVKILPYAIPIASQIPHGVGLAWGAKLKGEKIAVLTTFGDGATSEGEFHEGLNFAGVYRVPIVFLCSNNQFAISVTRDQQTATATLAEKAYAYGFDGICVDGLDIIAMYQVMSEALEKARRGGGPTFVEAITYRMCDHTTADDASIYQDPAELETWKARDASLRMRKFLESRGLWSAQDEEKLRKEAKAFVDQTVAELEGMKPADEEEIFTSTFAEMTPRLQQQLEDLKESRST